MNIFKRLWMSVYVVALCALVYAPSVQAGSKIPLKGLFKVLKTDDIGFGHSLLHSGAIENMYQFGPGKAKNKENGYKGKSEGDSVIDLIRVLWFRVQEDFQLNPTQQGPVLGLDGEIFGQLMNHIYSETIYNNKIIKGTVSPKGKILKKGFVNVWHTRCKEIAKNKSGVSACSLKKVVLLVDTIRKSLDFCNKEKRYKERIVQGILWAFFFHKLKNKSLDEKIIEINATINKIDEKYKDKSKALEGCYSNKELKNFEQKTKELNAESQLNIISKEYDVTLHYLLNKLVGKYPSVVSQGNYPYEYEKGKFSTSKPNCYEAALLDMFSILWHNPAKGCYDNSLLPEKLLDGKGFTRLRQALKNLNVAENNEIRSDAYSYDINGKKHSSLARLYDIINDKKLEDQVNKLKFEDVNTSYINRAEINQEWFNIVSNIKGVEYHSELKGEKIFEVNPGVKNFIKTFNYFYGTNEKSVNKLGGLISTDYRIITFKKTKKEDAPNEIEISVNDKGNNFYFNMTVNIMTGHVELKVPEREESKSKVIKKDVSKALLDSKNINNINILTLLASKDLLKEKIEWDVSMLHSIYYSLLLKDARIKLDIIKDILNRPIDIYNQLKDLVYNLIESLPDDDYIRGKLYSFVFVSEKYKSDNKLKKFVENKEFIKKYGDMAIKLAIELGKKDIINLLLIHEDIDVNLEDDYGKTPLTVAIESGQKDIVKLLLECKDIHINAKYIYGKTPLPVAINSGDKDIVKLLLCHKKIKLNEKSINIVLLIKAIDNGYKDIVELLLKYLDIDVNEEYNRRGTPLIIAIKKRDKDIVRLLLRHENIDVNVKTKTDIPLIVAFNYYNVEIIKLLLAHKNIDINSKGYSGPLLTKAIEWKNLEVLRLLFKREDLDVNKENGWKKSSLFLALEAGAINLAGVIIAHKSVEEKIEKVDWSKSLGQAQKLLKDKEYKKKEKKLKDIIGFIENKIEQVKKLKEKMN